MKYNYQNISISKDFYKTAEGFSKCLERLDPSEQYRGTELAGYDAFQRQLKRFDIKVAGPCSDRGEVTDFRNSLQHRTVLLFSQNMFPEQ